jgi:sensor histidine kinase YesM
MNLILGLARLDKKRLLIDTLENLAVFLRFNYQVRDHLIPFSMEYRHTKSYLAIQENRFGPLLSIEEEIDKTATGALVPPYLLQTIAENAFKHGLEKKLGEKKLALHFRREGNLVVLEVRDNGIGRLAEKMYRDDSSGFGLENIRKRLELIFGKEQVTVRLDFLEEGTNVFVTFPYYSEMR